MTKEKRLEANSSIGVSEADMARGIMASLERFLMQKVKEGCLTVVD
jgi:hypothetical protein